MKTLSDSNKDELRNLMQNEMDRRRNETDENGEPLRVWTNAEIDRLLGIESGSDNAEDGQNVSNVYAGEHFAEYRVPEIEEKPEAEADTLEISEQRAPIQDERIKSIFNDEVKSKKSNDFTKSMKSITGKASGFAQGFLMKGKKLAESLKASGEQEEKRFLLEDEDAFENDGFELPDGYEEEDDDIKVVDFDDGDDVEEAFNDDEAGKTRQIDVIEKPGVVIKKGFTKDDSDLETAPTIIAADEAVKNDNDSDDFKNMLREAEEIGQITMPGFAEQNVEERPEKIEESEAEKELFKRRKAKIDNFVLFGTDGENDPYGTDGEKERLGDLFDTHDERPRRVEEPEFVGVEYSQIKDARRVRRYLISQKKKSFSRTVLQSILLVAAVVVGMVSASITTVAGDGFITIASNLSLITLSLIVSNQMIAGSFEKLGKKIFDTSSAASFGAILCFVQTVLMLVLYFLEKNTVSVFGGVGICLLLLSELTSYVTFCRTADALELCTGVNKDKLYSIEGISDDKDATELGKFVKSPSPRIKYSAKTRFPSHLVELCTGETSLDRKMRFIFPAVILLSIINLIVAGVVNRNFAVGFAAFTVTLSMCIPAYASLLVQLPLRWINKRFNKIGGMISSQNAVNELCRTNAIILDSKDLFDQNMCSMHGFKDFKNVRVDDVMLYAAAMVIRSGGPLTGVFDQVVVNRRDILPTVKSFSYEEKLGVSGWIYNQRVILGNKRMMINHNIDVPDSIDEDKYLLTGHEVMYLAIAHKLAAMMVVDYAPNKRLSPYLKKLRDGGVTVLVRNCDQNVTDALLSECYKMRLDNVKILNSSAGRVFKKYKSRPKVNSKAVAIHDGTTYTLMRSLCTADMLRHSFKVSNAMVLAGILMGFAIVLILSALNVVADLPMIFVVMLQVLLSSVFAGATRLVCSK